MLFPWKFVPSRGRAILALFVVEWSPPRDVLSAGRTVTASSHSLP